jgi:hypothetical protein
MKYLAIFAALLASPAAAQTLHPIVSGVQTCTTSDAQLPTSSGTINGVELMANTANTGKVYIGGSGVTATTGFPLASGVRITYSLAQLSMVHMICDNGTDKLYYTAR